MSGKGLLVAVAVAGSSACGASTRDVVPESHDVRGVLAPRPQEYEYVARRPMGAVAVAESRGLAKEVVKDVTDGLADALDTCATRLAAEGRLVAAAARVAAHIDRGGAPENLALTLTPGAGPTANALLCFVSPFKLVRFPAADVDPATRGIALEAYWGATRSGSTPPAVPGSPPP